jgi:hypothetical protein
MKNNTIKQLLGVLGIFLLGMCVNMLPGVPGVFKYALILAGWLCLRPALGGEQVGNGI